MNRSMHLRDRTLKTREKLDCMHTIGGGVVRALRASPVTSIYHLYYVLSCSSAVEDHC